MFEPIVMKSIARRWSVVIHVR